jgi:hypothetical protein
MILAFLFSYLTESAELSNGIKNLHHLSWMLKFPRSE